MHQIGCLQESYRDAWSTEHTVSFTGVLTWRSLCPVPVISSFHRSIVLLNW